LYLRSTPKYAAHPDLVKSHPVLERLLVLKQSLSTLEDLDFDISDSQSGEDGFFGDDFDESDEDLDLDDEDEEVFDLFNHTRVGKKKKPRLELNELQGLLQDAEADISDLAPTVNGATSPEKKRKKTEKQPLSLDREEMSEPPKKKQRTTKKDTDSERSTGPRTTVFHLVEPEFEYSVSGSAPASSFADAADSFGEHTILQSVDAADKKARKKSLRFHTSKIEGAALRRDKGAKSFLGGDDDIPYKERKKQKEIREAKEIAKKGRGVGGDDLSDGDPEVDMGLDFAGFGGEINGGEPGKRSRDESSEDDIDPGEYYSLVERSAKEKKERKRAEYNAARIVERYGFSTSCSPRTLLTSVTTVMP
jgi:U3 small nucleolar RNA-associated protein 3